MSSLHPESRQDNKYCRGMRDESAMVADFTEPWGAPPTILQGIVEFLKCDNLANVLSPASSCAKHRYMSYNCQNALDMIRRPDFASLPTIECRQHRGTLDGEEIVQWVKLLVCIIKSLEAIHPEPFTELLNVVQHETWEQTDNDRANSWNQANLGPILAESTFTIIDILEFLNLYKSADYYRNRLFRVKGGSRRPPLEIFSFDTDAHAAARRATTPAERLRADQSNLERTFQSMMLAGAATEDEDGAGLDFNPDDSLWSMISREDGQRHELSPPFHPDFQKIVEAAYRFLRLAAIKLHC